MKKYENVKQDLILNGYKNEKLNEFTNLFVEDYLECEYEKLSESLDKYIAAVQDGLVMPNMYNSLKFGEIVSDYEKNGSKSLVTSAFRNAVTNKFNQIVQRQPLLEVLKSGNVMGYQADFEAYGINPYYFSKDVLSSSDMSSLCSVHPFGYDFVFIRLVDLITLLNDKGLEKGFLFVEKNDGMGFELLIDYEAIMYLGSVKLKRV